MNNALRLKTSRRCVEIGGETFEMDFDMQALAYAEQAYHAQYGREENISIIVRELFEAKMSACMAVAYGAIRSAGQAVTWEKFTKEIFTFENFDVVFAEVSAGIEELFGVGDGDGAADGGAGDPKN